VVGVPRTIDGDVRRWIRRSGVATHYRWERYTTDGARRAHHAPSMGKIYDVWGAGNSPCTNDKRKTRHMERGGLTMHYRWQKNTTDGARRAHHALSMAENTTDGARQTHHAPTIREKHDRWGTGRSPCTNDKRKTRRMGRGDLTTGR